MIAIVNVGPLTNDKEGLHNYEVRINSKVITTFTHIRRDGLATCLRKAAVAVEETRAKELYNDLVQLSEKVNL